MTRVFLDTNVLIDVLLHREPFVHDSAQVLNKGFNGEIELYSTPLSFATCVFVTHKKLGYANSIEALKLFERHIHIATMDAVQYNQYIN